MIFSAAAAPKVRNVPALAENVDTLAGKAHHFAQGLPGATKGEIMNTDGVMLEQCPICQGYLDQEQATRILAQHDSHVPIAQRVAICHECVCVLCTCGQCSAYNAEDAESAEAGSCWRAPRGPGGTHPLALEKSLCRDGWRQARPWTWDDIREAFGGELPSEAGAPPVFDSLTVSEAQVDIEVLHAAMRISREMRKQWDRTWKLRDFRSFATTDDPCEPVIRSALGLLLNNHDVTLVGDDQWQWEKD
jgi:hypothetical protein